MIGVLKYAIPFYWPYAVVKGVFNAPVWLLKKTWQATKAAWNYPKTTLGKCILRPTLVWFALPGTTPWTFYHLARMLGFEHEMDFLVQATTGFASETGYIVLDVLIKVFMYLTALAASYLPALIGYLL